ncbi:MAG: ParA family protein [Deltaproteobacteria bacterium]
MKRSKRVKRTMRTVALFKLKGGIGATTTVANLVSAFDDLGHRVAALDLDPQRSLSSWARLGEGILSRTVEPVAEAGELAGKVADKQRGGTEVLLLDAPPGFVDAGLAAALVADLVLIPCGPSPLDLMSMRQTVGLVREMRRAGRPAMALLPARVTPTGLGRDLVEALAAEGVPVMPSIRQRVAVAASALSGRTVREADPSSPSVAEFSALARAILEVLP